MTRHTRRHGLEEVHSPVARLDAAKVGFSAAKTWEGRPDMQVGNHAGASRAVACGLLLVTLAACNAQPGGVAGGAAVLGEATVSVSLKSTSTAERLTVAVSSGDGPDFATLSFELARAGTGWSAFLTGIPAGPGRRFDVTARDSAGSTVASGWAKADIVAGSPVQVRILLSGPSTPSQNQSPVIDYLGASTDVVGPRGKVTLRVSASDPDPADTITYTWSATCGAVDDPAKTEAIWTAPSVAGTCDMTIAVSDGRASVSAVLTVTVQTVGRAISGTRLVTHWPDPPAVPAGAPAPDVTTSLPPQVLLRDGSGGWTVLPGGHVGPGGTFVEGSFGSDGSFVVPGAPPGEYVLCHRPAGETVTCMDGGSDVVDLGYDLLGRPDQTPASRPTPVTFSFTGMDAWNPLLERIEITSSGANLWDEVTAGAFLRGGVVAATVVEDWGLGNGVQRPLNLLAPADVLHAHQLSARSFYTGFDIHFYAAATHAAPAPGSTPTGGTALQDGQAASITTRLEPLPLTASAEVDWDPAAFESHRQSMGPAARTALPVQAHRFTVGASAFSLEFPSPAAAGAPALVDMTLPAGAVRAAGKVWYGRFLPAHWNEWRSVRFAAEVSYLATGATLPWRETSVIERRDALPANTGPFAPAVTPVGSPQIGGASAFDDRAGVGETPVLSWTAPFAGTPTGYLVEVYRLGAAGAVTTRTSVLRYATARLTVTLPPGLLETGATYFARITALVSTAPISAPYRGASVLAQASTLTGTFSR